MRRNFLLLLAILSLAFASFACSVFGGDDTDNGTEIESPQFEEVSIDATSLWDMGDLQSYRVDFNMSFDGTSGSNPANGSITMYMEFTSIPPAQHTVVNLRGFEMDFGYGDMPSIEFYTMEGTIHVNLGTGGGWISFPNEVDDLFSEGLISYEDFVDLPERASRKLQPENVNGITAWHYVLDEGDFVEGFTTYDEVSGDFWIAVDGGYVVKMDVSMTGTFAPDIIRHQPIDQGTMSVSFTLRDVNTNFTIKLPQEAASDVETPSPEDTASPGGEVGIGEWVREDVPLPEGAVIDVASGGNAVAHIQLSLEETVEFFQTQLPANGWIVDFENYVPTDVYNGGFVKGGETLTLNLAPNIIYANRIDITLSIQ
jgi:hypothetical protein